MEEDFSLKKSYFHETFQTFLLQSFLQHPVYHKSPHLPPCVLEAKTSLKDEANVAPMKPQDSKLLPDPNADPRELSFLISAPRASRFLFYQKKVLLFLREAPKQMDL